MPFDEVLPFLMGGIFLMIPIVALLTSHQQKMAQIIHGNKQVADDEVRREIQELRQMVQQQAIALDNLANTQSRILQRMEANEPLTQRLGQNQ